MTPSSGAISLSDIRTELGLSGAIGLGDSTVREYSFVPSGAISFADNYAVYKDTIASNTQNQNMRSRAVSAGWNQSAPLKHTLIINSGIVVGSSSTGSFALDTGTTFPANSKLKITNNGSIVGAGGAGGAGAETFSGGLAGSAGGPALNFQYATFVQNNSIIGGGGGGGGGGAMSRYGSFGAGGGGGGGNNVGAGASGYYPGTNGTTTNGGNGGNSGVGVGTGGGAGSNGGAGPNGNIYSSGGGGGGGGGLGGSGGIGGFSYTVQGAGGGAGSATNGATTFATWLATGTRYGTIG